MEAELTRSRRSVRQSAGALLLAVSLVGCGGGGGNQRKTSAAKPNPPASTATTRLEITALRTNGFRFDKKTLRAKAGRLVITLRNKDDIPHNVRLQRGTNCCFKPGSTDIGGTTTISGGEAPISGAATVTPGKYTFYCAIAGHWQNGMRGVLTVT